MTTSHIPVTTVEDGGDSVNATDRAPNSRLYEIATGIVVIAFGVGVYFAAAAIEVGREGQSFGPRWWPTALSIAMVVIGLILIVQAILERITSDEPPITKSGGVVLVATLALIAAYGFAWQFFDFRAVTIFLLAGLVAVAGGRGVKALVIFPVVTTFLLWSIFGLLLQVPL
ncbi:MAG: tripartite tricarboxylate transporter TctB family protein [Rhodococcus sp. (in: high G+C Gram-positive bacteria)]